MLGRAQPQVRAVVWASDLADTRCQSVGVGKLQYGSDNVRARQSASGNIIIVIVIIINLCSAKYVFFSLVSAERGGREAGIREGSTDHLPPTPAQTRGPSHLDQGPMLLHPDWAPNPQAGYVP